jgi:CheY-like chemotaxis protein
MRILLIEDNEVLRHIMSEMLVQLDPSHEIDDVGNGQEALLRYREWGPYDIVLTDYQHPGLNGYELVAAIRKEKPTQAIACVTGNVEIGATLWQDFKVPTLEKPFDAKQLREMLEVLRRVNETQGNETKGT